MKSEVSITMNRYYDDEGNPTCCHSMTTGEICKFYQVIGGTETCFFAPFSKKTFKKEPLNTRKGGRGTLIPGGWCPLFV